MSARRPFLRAAALFGAAVTGLLIAHELDYRLVVPDPTHRHDLLLRSGHGWLQHGLVLGMVAGLLAIVTAIALGASRQRSGGGIRDAGTRLALIQAGGFVLLEAVERILVGAPPDDRLLVITVVGVAVQAVTAFVGALLLGLIERVARLVASSSSSRPRLAGGSRGFTPTAPAFLPSPRRLLDAVGVRGPPVPACR